MEHELSELDERNANIRKLIDSARYFNESFAIKNILNYHKTYQSLPTLFIVTPTYTRCTQLADLHRFRNTLLHVPKVIWIIIEDAAGRTPLITKFLNESKIPYVHLYKESLTNLTKPDRNVWTKHKGIFQRNKALAWLKESQFENGVVYFADDDNAYDTRLFEEVIKPILFFVVPFFLLKDLV